jgi:hypothetical protein
MTNSDSGTVMVNSINTTAPSCTTGASSAHTNAINGGTMIPTTAAAIIPSFDRVMIGSLLESSEF